MTGTPPGGPRPGPPSRVPAAAGAAAPPAPPLNLAVRVSAPRRVFVRGRGLDVELGGEVAVRGTVAEPVPQGELEFRRGTLDVLARRLTFDRGTIDFASGTLTPRLDLAAKAQVRQTAIAVTVQGPATSPTIAVSSTPELPQDEILARLLFDRGTGDLSPLEIAQLAAAAAELAGVGGGAGGVLDRARGALGLDRLGLSGGGAGAGPAVEAGRYVAPGVFLGVRQGAQGRTGVGVEVEITPRLKLEGQTAAGPAGDRLGLTYEFEY
jgi:translocation and assembly module TamB